MNKPSIICLICYVEHEFYDMSELGYADKFKITDRFIKHKWYCPIFKFIYKVTGKKII